LNEYRVPELDKGVYYWEVTVTDSQGNTQNSFELYIDEDTKISYYGILRFEVE